MSFDIFSLKKVSKIFIPVSFYQIKMENLLNSTKSAVFVLADGNTYERPLFFVCEPFLHLAKNLRMTPKKSETQNWVKKR